MSMSSKFYKESEEKTDIILCKVPSRADSIKRILVSNGSCKYI